MRYLALSFVGCLVLLASVSLASAQDEQREKAKQFFRAGEQSYVASQYDVAAQAFEEAYSILPVPAIAFSTAQAYRLQYFIDKDPTRLKRAVELYRKYVDEVEQGGRRKDAVASLAELEPILLRLDAQQAQLGQSAIEAASAQVRTHIMITSSVRDAVVRLGDAEAVPVPIDKDVTAGEYRVRVTADGYFPYDEIRTVSEGQFHLVPVQLTEKPARVDIRGAEGASVSVDGRAVGVLPMQRPLQLAAGKHLISVGERGHKGWSRELVLERGEEVQLSPDLSTTRQRKLSYLVAGSSLLALGVGGVYFAVAAGSNSEAEDLERIRQQDGFDAQQFASYRGAIADRDSQRGLGIGFVTAGGILAVTGALLYIVDMPGMGSDQSQQPAVDSGPVEQDEGFTPMALVPSVSPESAGLALRGRF